MEQFDNLKKRENMLRKSMWPSRSKVVDSSGKENTEVKEKTNTNVDKFKDDDTTVPAEVRSRTGGGGLEDSQNNKGNGNPDREDMVSGFLYDRLQKEVINLRKFCEAKESSLNAKDEEIKMLMKKVDALTKSMEIESKKVKREAAAREKEATSMKLEDTKKTRSITSSRRLGNQSTLKVPWLGEVEAFRIRLIYYPCRGIVSDFQCKYGLLYW
ncbi:hypothetical protein Patl1_09663 [Pistacia atlantica]|uniref:Uncharacterized protein n=1 Tax=Pistacia atlantica TaxID=434234 RepID=A0ACC1A3A0_9ROSI|nr:hypothetical protein Patl1_09663 [Pistacia atlantica]